MHWQGKKLGDGNITTPPGEDEWLCPYFDPVTRTLRLRRRDGNDSPTYWEVGHAARRKGLRPLLLLAHAEGLLDKVPGTFNSLHTGYTLTNTNITDAHLTSLDLATNIQSGYHVHSLLSNLYQGRNPLLQTHYKLAFNKTSTTDILGSFGVLGYTPGQRIRHFPYVDEMQHLRIWDVDKGAPLTLVSRDCVNGGVPPTAVRKRSPRFFAWAQSLGYWLNIE